MATLSAPTLQVDLLTGSTMANVTTTVSVVLEPSEVAMLSFGYKLQLVSDVRGEDNWFNGGDDDLLLFPERAVTGSGTYTFGGLVPRAWLDEDNGNDEIYSGFKLTGTGTVFGVPVNFSTSVRSSILTGEFGL